MRYPIAPWARNVIILQWEAHFVKRLIGRRRRFLFDFHVFLAYRLPLLLDPIS